MEDVVGERRVSPSVTDRYPSVQRRSHQWRTRRANGIAALALIGAIVVVFVLLMLFA